jgi:hypothetical protein
MEKFFFTFYKIKYIRNQMKLALILGFFLALSKSQSTISSNTQAQLNLRPIGNAGGVDPFFQLLSYGNLNQEISTLKNSNTELVTAVKALIEKDTLLQNQI